MTRSDVMEAALLLLSVAVLVAGGMFAVSILFAQRGLSALCVP